MTHAINAVWQVQEAKNRFDQFAQYLLSAPKVESGDGLEIPSRRSRPHHYF